MSGLTDNDGVDFFSAEEAEAIVRCNIQVNDNNGRYSEELVRQAIEELRETMLQAVNQGGDGAGELQPHQQYCVKKGEQENFFARYIYTVHGGVGAASPSEEAILLEIEAIRRSEKAIKNKLFKLKETGGSVVFGPWWNYSLRRVLELSSDDTLTAESFGDYTAVKILRSLFEFITNDLGDIVKRGHLALLKDRFSVDWQANARTARRVIDHCGGESHFLHAELAAVERHLEFIRTKPKSTEAPAPAAPAPVAISAPVANAIPAASAQGGGGEDAKAKRESEARQARMAQMKARARSTAPVPDPAWNAATTSAPAADQGAVASAPAPTSSSRGGVNNATMTSSSRGGPSSYSGAGGRNQAAQNPPPEHERKPAAQPPARSDRGSRAPGPADRHAPREDAAYRGHAPERPPPQPAAGRDYQQRDERRESSYRHGDEPQRSGRDFDSRGSGQCYGSRDDDRYTDSRSAGRPGDRSYDRGGGDGGSYRSYDQNYSRSDYNGGGRDGYDYGSRRDTRPDDHNRSDYRREDQDYRPREETSRDYDYRGSSAPKHGRSQDYGEMEDRRPPPKRFRGADNAVAPAAPAHPAPAASAGRGRGRDKNLPAWMTAQNGPTGMARSESSASSNPSASSSNYAPAPIAASPIDASAIADAVALAMAPPVGGGGGGGGAAPARTAPSGGGAGRGRGRDKNLPAWMTKNPADQRAPTSESGPAGVSSGGPHNPGPGVSGVGYSAPISSGVGAGRGRGRDKNLPAWMTKNQTGQGAPTSESGPAGMSSGGSYNPVAGSSYDPGASTTGNAASRASSMAQPNSSGGQGQAFNAGQAGMGRGRGRGKNMNLPAWMTKNQTVS